MRNSAYPVLINVVARSDYLLELEYDNNERRIYDFKPNLGHSFFKELQSQALFKNVFINDGELAWSSGQDFCPHTLYEKSILQM